MQHNIRIIDATFLRRLLFRKNVKKRFLREIFKLVDFIRNLMQCTAEIVFSYTVKNGNKMEILLFFTGDF